MVRSRMGWRFAAAILVILLAAGAPVATGCRKPSPPEAANGANQGAGSGGSGGTAAPGSGSGAGQLRIRVSDLRVHAVVRNYEWVAGWSDGPICVYPEFDVSRGGDVVVGQGSVVVKVFVTQPVITADVDKALTFSEDPSATEWTADYEQWLCLDATEEDPRLESLGGTSREFTFEPGRPGPFAIKVAGSLPLGGSTTLGQDLAVNIARASEPLVSLEGVEYPHVRVAIPPAGTDPGFYARRFTLPPGTWHFRATFSEPMDTRQALPNGVLPPGLLQVRQKLVQGNVSASAHWEDFTHLLVTIEATKDTRGPAAVFLDGLAATSGGRVGAQGGLDLEFAPAIVLGGHPVGPVGSGAAATVEWPFSVNAVRGAVAPDGRHALLWEVVLIDGVLGGYTLGCPWLLDLDSGQATLVDLTGNRQIPLAGWSDSQTVFLSTCDGLFRLDVSGEGVAPTVQDVFMPGKRSDLWGFGVSTDGKTIALAEDGTLLLVDASTLEIASRTPDVFPDDLFRCPGTETDRFQPITWIPGRPAVALERVDDGVQSVFAIPSGKVEEGVFSGPGGRNMDSVIAWSPDGKTALAAEPNLTIVTNTRETPLASDWQAEDYRIGRLPDGAFSLSGVYVAVAYRDKVYVHNVATGALETAFDGWLLNWTGEDRLWVVREAGR